MKRNSPLTLTDLELISPKGEPLEFKKPSDVLSRFGQIGVVLAGRNCRCWSSFGKRSDIELVLATTQAKHPETLVDELRAEGYNGEYRIFCQRRIPQ